MVVPLVNKMAENESINFLDVNDEIFVFKNNFFKLKWISAEPHEY